MRTQNKTDLVLTSTILVLFLGILSSCSNNQGGAQQAAGFKEQLELERKIYEKAKQTGDHHTAVVSLNRMLALDSSLVRYHDSLPRHYLALSNVKSAAYYAEKSLEQDPGNEKMLELAGFVYFESGSFKKAEEKFTKLYEITQEAKYLYQLSQIYGYMGDRKKGNEMIEMILKDNSLDDVYVDLATTTGAVQDVKIKAAAWFVRANLQDNPKQALPFIKKALQVQPDFEIARKMKDEFELQIEQEKAMQYERKLRQMR